MGSGIFSVPLSFKLPLTRAFVSRRTACEFGTFLSLDTLRVLRRDQLDAGHAEVRGRRRNGRLLTAKERSYYANHTAYLAYQSTLADLDYCASFLYRLLRRVPITSAVRRDVPAVLAQLDDQEHSARRSP